MTPTLPADVSTLLDSLISELTLSTSQGGFGWNTSDVSAFITDITSSSVLLNELSAMQLAGWIYTTDTHASDDQSATDPYTVLNNQPPTTSLTSNYINGTDFPSFSKAANLIAVIAYEAGHAEDPQLNTIEYSGTDLQYGAWIALDLLSEGKSLLNNEAVQQQLTGTNGGIPVIGLGGPTTVFDAAASEGIKGQSGIGYGLVIGYWTHYVTDELTKPGFLPSIESTCPPDIYNAFAGVNISLATNLVFAQPAAGTTSMEIDFTTSSTETLSSYIIDFGGYGDAAPSAPYFTAPSFTSTNPAPQSLITYQEFTYTNGDLLKEEYIFNSGTMIAGTQASETLIGAGTLAGLQAGGSLDTLIDITGTNSTFENVNQKSVTEEALNGTASTKNVFKFGGGTNVLIGDIGHNTFVENLSASNAVNIIYGGGGVSTYELSGLIDILYTETTPTAQQIEDLSLKQLSATIPSGVGSYGDTTYIIDPNVKDVLELPSYQPGSNYVPGEGFPEYYQGTPTYSSVAGNYYPTLQSAIGSYYGVQNGNDAAFANFVYLKKDHYPANYDIVGQPYNNGDGIIGPFLGAEIVNGYLPGGFGDNMLEDTSKKSDEVFITLGTSSSSAITMSSAPSMAILHPSSVTVANPSPWAPDMASGYLHRSAYQMEVLGSEKTPTALGSPAIDLIASTTKWMPTITIQVSGS